MVERKKSNLKILIITPHFPPDGGPSANLFYLLSKEFVKRGHCVDVVCAVPHYPTGIVQKNYKSLTIKGEKISGINVIHVPLLSLNRKNLYLRMIQFLMMQLGMTIASLRFCPDIVITSNPALQTGLPFLAINKIKNTKSIFSVHDFYPDVGIRLAIFRSKIIVKVVEYLELKCYKEADVIRVLSDSFVNLLRRYKVFNNKIELIYDWVDINYLKPYQKRNDFSIKFNLADTFNILYAGNIGYSQGLDIIIRAASLLKEKEDIRFVIVGDGAYKPVLAKLIEQSNLNNIVLIPYQKKEWLPLVLATGDIALVCLKKGVSFTSLPSKIYSILACGRPIIACLDKGSDSWNLIERARAGVCIPPEDPSGLVREIIEMKNNPGIREFLGKNGRNYCINYHSVESAADKFELLFLDHQ